MPEFPTTTEAAILVRQREPLIVDRIDLPKTIEVGQVLVEMISSGICGSQLGEIDGVKGADPYLPHLLGHEGFAHVLAVGPGVKNIQEKDSVVLHWRPGAGIQANPPKYRWRDKPLNAGWVTTFNRHAIVSENRCTKIPDSTDPDAAALFGCAITTGFGVVENNANLKMGESVVVFGAGGIGLSIVQAAALISAWPIIAIDRFDSRLELARTLGATHCINNNSIDAEIAIHKCLGDQPLDVFIDNTGVPEIIELGYKMSSNDGRIILVGVPHSGSKIKIHSLPLHFGKQLTGSHGGETVPHQDIPRYLRLQRQGHLKLSRLVSAHYSIEEINDAISAMRDGATAGRVMIRF